VRALPPCAAARAAASAASEAMSAAAASSASLAAFSDGSLGEGLRSRASLSLDSVRLLHEPVKSRSGAASERAPRPFAGRRSPQVPLEDVQHCTQKVEEHCGHCTMPSTRSRRLAAGSLLDFKASVACVQQ